VSRFKLILRYGGVIVFLGGLSRCPLGYRGSPKRDLNAFNNFADLGAFIKMGLILMGVGVIFFFLSALLPGDDDYWDDP
jgi:heme/copper-type cytochrome/quinol oxidase subunit 1